MVRPVKSHLFLILVIQATEALMNNQSGIKCDVWSLGVLLWETVTLGGTPYSTVATKEVAMRVARGMRLPRVPGLSDQLYQVST